MCCSILLCDVLFLCLYFVWFDLLLCVVYVFGCVGVCFVVVCVVLLCVRVVCLFVVRAFLWFGCFVVVVVCVCVLLFVVFMMLFVLLYFV